MKRILLILFIIFPSFVFSEDLVHILCYHRFNDETVDLYDFTPSEFETQLTQMTNAGFRFVSWQEVLSGEISGPGNVLITTDDGDLSLQNLYPMFLNWGIKPLHFIPAGVLAGEESELYFPTVSFEDLKMFRRYGATIGVHGYRHLFVNQMLFETNRQAFYDEIYRASAAVNAGMSTNGIDLFAYPYGIFSDVTQKHLSLSGFQYGFTAYRYKYGPATLPLEENEDLLEIPRYIVMRDNWDSIFLKMKSFL